MNDKTSLVYKFLRPGFTLIFKVLFNPHYINKDIIPREGKVVIAGNHKHALDPIFVDSSTKRVIHTLAKKELHDSPFGWFFRAVGSIPVDSRAKHNKGALDAAINYLNEGYAINVSPEGARNYTEEILLPFKPGAVVMAQRTGCKVIPYSITGDYKFRSRDLLICYGEPLDVSQMSVEDANALLFETIKKLLIENQNADHQNADYINRI